MKRRYGLCFLPAPDFFHHSVFFYNDVCWNVIWFSQKYTVRRAGEGMEMWLYHRTLSFHWELWAGLLFACRGHEWQTHGSGQVFQPSKHSLCVSCLFTLAWSVLSHSKLFSLTGYVRTGSISLAQTQDRLISLKRINSRLKYVRRLDACPDFASWPVPESQRRSLSPCVLWQCHRHPFGDHLP